MPKFVRGPMAVLSMLLALGIVSPPYAQEKLKP
jgi:hypothetical protein